LLKSGCLYGEADKKSATVKGRPLFLDVGCEKREVGNCLILDGFSFVANILVVRYGMKD
jgi:hypothetical protein